MMFDGVSFDNIDFVMIDRFFLSQYLILFTDGFFYPSAIPHPTPLPAGEGTDSLLQREEGWG